MTVRLMDAERNPLPDASFTGEITILFPFLAGTLFGEPEQAAAIRKRVRVGDRLRFDLTALRRPVESAARPWRDDDPNRTLVIVPREARVLRLGSLSLRADDELFTEQTVVMDPRTKDTLLLVYVDRACSIRGSVRAGSGTAEHTIEFPGAGFHWVRMRQIGQGRTRLTYDPVVREATVGLLVVGRGEGGAER